MLAIQLLGSYPAIENFTLNRNAYNIKLFPNYLADKVGYEDIDGNSSDIFCLANQMRKENVDVVGDKPVKNNAWGMSMNEEVKPNALTEHYERLRNV